MSKADESVDHLRQQVAAMKEIIANLPPTLSQALELHAKWLAKEERGVRLDLSGTDLSRAILRGVNLTEADLTDAKGISAFADRVETRRKRSPRSRQ